MMFFGNAERIAFKKSLLGKTSNNGTLLSDYDMSSSYTIVSVYLGTLIVIGAVLNARALILLNQVKRVRSHTNN